MAELYRQWPTLKFKYEFYSICSGFEGFETAAEGKIVEHFEDVLTIDEDGEPEFKLLSNYLFCED